MSSKHNKSLMPYVEKVSVHQGEWLLSSAIFYTSIIKCFL